MRGNRIFHDATRYTLTVLLFPIFISWSAISSYAQNTADQSPIAANELVRRVVGSELKAEQQDHSHWSFRLRTQKPNGQKELDEVVETKDGDLKLPIRINGRQLTPKQKQESDKRIQQLVRNPDPLRKARAQEDEDTSRSQRLLKMLPDAFQFKYGQRQGDLVHLNFVPNPKFHPPTHEAEVFHAMKGILSVDSKQLRLAGIDGQLMREVKFGGGILGHLNQGGTFEVKQTETAPGYWELTLLKVQMKGKALFFKTIGVQQNYTRSDFKHLPDDLTLAKGAQMVEKQAEPSETQAKQASLKDH